METAMSQTCQDKEFNSWTTDNKQVLLKNIYQVSKKLQERRESWTS